MATTSAAPAPAREVLIRVRDGDGALLRGSVISWSEDGEPRGHVDPSDGHLTAYPISSTSVVGVTASYEGDSQARKLAIDQMLCEFEFPDVHPNPPVSTPPAAPAPGPVPSPLGEPASKSPWWSAALVALIAAIPVAYVGYLQYGPGMRDKGADSKVVLNVYVKDAVTAAPIPRATVSVQTASVPAPALTDSQGVATFDLPGGKGESMTIVGSAAGYEDGAVTTRTPNQLVQLQLRPKPAPGAAAPVPPPSGIKSSVAAIAGTWEVRVSGDLALRRIRSGTFDFSALPDGRTAVGAQIDLDGTATRLSGTAARQNDRLFLTCSAQAGAESWQAQGQLSLAGSTLQGYLTDAKGQQVPVTLRKP